MNRLAVPWLCVGPSGSGKTRQLRRWIEEAHGTTLTYPLEVRTFSVGDGYEARVFASPYHFEIDIPNLSMQDKQIIGDLLTMFLSSRDVLSSLHATTRKLVILRRAHCLSLPAAIRVRAILQQYVQPSHAPGMIWMTAREVTGPLALLEETFVRCRVPRISLEAWKSHTDIPPSYQTEEAWDKLEGRPERAVKMAAHFPTPLALWPRRIQNYYDEMIAEMMLGARHYGTTVEPNMDAVQWIRGRVYEALSFCQTGPEILDACAAAVTRLSDTLHPTVFWEIMEVLSNSEPHTSYRTPLALEWAMLNMFEVMRKYHETVNGRGIPQKQQQRLTALEGESATHEGSNAPRSTPGAGKKGKPVAKSARGGKRAAATNTG